MPARPAELTRNPPEKSLENPWQFRGRPRHFPARVAIRGEFEVNGSSTSRYNCIAWSLGLTDRWLNPGRGWAECDTMNYQFGRYQRMRTMDFSLVRGYGKLDAFGRVTEFRHQARQLADGSWSSKLGHIAQVRHPTPQSLNGDGYGVPVAVYVRYNPNFR